MPRDPPLCFMAEINNEDISMYISFAIYKTLLNTHYWRVQKLGVAEKIDEKWLALYLMVLCELKIEI